MYLLLEGTPESVNIEFEHDFDVKEVRQCLQESPGLVVLDNPLKNVYPMPLTSKKRMMFLLAESEEILQKKIVFNCGLFQII